ncbi:hypothetical protein GCM10023322_53680 [Rugosimonospora acidiphila]|uniref:Methylated-DNA-[protein]-cysteine S-methyltransferase DNA binding domain-containing protein n=1 Tax=Rugosimonospora acidiphila TaxID=556531 RepID=A0ABP9S934_9ACTN
MAHMTADFVEDVLAVVESIPPGRVMSYGAIADYLGRGGPRQVGAVMARYGAAVPWYRVVNASGRTPPGHEQAALSQLRAEGTALRGDHVNMRAAAWYPESPPMTEIPPADGDRADGDDHADGDDRVDGDPAEVSRVTAAGRRRRDAGRRRRPPVPPR